MRKTNFIRHFLQTHFTSNPLSYLGWLGLLGLFGVAAPALLPFLLCFTFFSYGSMVPDELFWKNVNRASARAFWSVFALDAAVIVLMFVRGIAIVNTGEWVKTTIQGNLVSMGISAYGQYSLAVLTLYGNIVLMILVFTISMMRFRKQEKNMLEMEG